MPPTDFIKVLEFPSRPIVDNDVVPYISLALNSEARTSREQFLSVDSLTQRWNSFLQTIADIGDPGADRILFWDDSEDAYKPLSLGAGLSITGTTLNVSTGSGNVNGTGTVGTIPYWSAADTLGSSPLSRLSNDSVSVNSATYAPPSNSQNTSGGLRLRLYDGAAPDYIGLGVESGAAWINTVGSGHFKIYHGAVESYRFSYNKFIPFTDDLIDLGDAVHRFKTIYMSGGLNLGSDATGDIYYRNGTGLLTRLPAGAEGQYLKITSGIPAWATLAGGGTITGSGGTGYVAIFSSSTAIGNSAIFDDGNNLIVTSRDIRLSTNSFIVSQGGSLQMLGFGTDNLINLGGNQVASIKVSSSYGGGSFAHPATIASTALGAGNLNDFADIAGRSRFITFLTVNSIDAWTGIANGTNGEEHIVFHGGLYDFTIAHNNNASSSGNRFFVDFAQDFVWKVGQYIRIVYNGTYWLVSRLVTSKAGTDLDNLTDPGADRIMFWDDSNGEVRWLTVGSGLAITGTTLATTGASGFTGSGTTNALPVFTGAGTLGDSFFQQGGTSGNPILSLGGVTASFPAFRRNSTTIQIRLADNSAYGKLEVADDAYDATNWNGSFEVPTKNAVRDKFESLTGATPGGSSGQVQYNNSGAFGGTPEFIVGASVPSIQDSASLALLTFGTNGSAVNNIKISNAATTANPKLEVVGSDTNISLDINAKGAGSIKLNADYVEFSKQAYIRNANGTWLDLGTVGNSFIAFGQSGGNFAGNYFRQQIIQAVGLGFSHNGSAPTVGLWSPSSGLLEVWDGVGSGNYHLDLKLRNLILTGGITPAINAQSGTSYTLVASDNGKIITCDNASAITVTVPSGLGASFNCVVIQKGAGQITFSPSSTTINNSQSHTKTVGQHAVVSLFADVADNFYLSGDTA